MSDATRPWPPLIVAANVPRAVRWRDLLLTLAAWGAFAYLLDHEFALSLHALELLGLGGAKADTNWGLYLERLAPFLLVAAALAAALVVFSLGTLRRRSRTLRMSLPSPLGDDRQARIAGLDEAALAAARDQRVVVVHKGERGLSIEAKVVRT
jgi:poly-beta-1,6-N-acetyl-D-glucosamine biosynthesis protein PgaD